MAWKNTGVMRMSNNVTPKAPRSMGLGPQADGPREVTEQLRLARHVRGVPIVGGLERVIDPRRRAGLEGSGDQLQMPAQLAIRVAGGGAAGPSGGVRELLGGGGGVRHRAMD